MSFDVARFDLFLFDFDGLLVDTERVHWKAYKLAGKQYDIEIDWEFEEYCVHSHYSDEQMRQRFREHYPKLKDVEWEEFYDKKKQAFMALVHSEEGVALLPGVDELLRSLHKRNVPRCVATNSAQELIDTVRDAKGNEALQLIDNWLTRDHYKKGKPHPECYITAVEKHLSAIKETRRDGRTLNVIGFEDSPRGLRALIDTQRHFARTFNSERINVVAVFVTSMNYPNLDEHLSESIVNGDAPARYVRVSALNDLTDDILKPHMR